MQTIMGFPFFSLIRSYIMSSNVVATGAASVTAILGTITTTATSVNAGVNALGNFAQAANIKSSAWLEEVREDTETLAISRQLIRDRRIAAKVAAEMHAIDQVVQDPAVKAHYDTTLAQLQQYRAAQAKAQNQKSKSNP